ncbi:MAG: hypothetical protein AB1489_31785 [Acidobacteriota bacterium]
MTMADVLAVISGLIIVGLGIPALLALLTIFFPKAVAQASHQIGSKPLRIFFRGLITFILFFLVIVTLGKANFGLLKFFSLIVTLAGLSLAMLGGAGLANQLAARYRALNNEQHSLLDLFPSTVLIELAAVLPLIGWFVVLPITFLLMLGAGCNTVLRRTASVQPHSEAIPNPAVTQTF